MIEEQQNDGNQQSPNILYILTEQQWAGAMSCAGNDDLHTPNMDRLAEEGVRFTNAYCSFPMCVPSRDSMFSGRMPHELGSRGARPTECHVNLSDEDMALTMGRLFRDAGYRCGWGGKWHWGMAPGLSVPACDDANHGFERVCGFDDFEVSDACGEFMRSDDDQPFLLVASLDTPHNIGEFSRDKPLPWAELEDVRTEDYPNLPSNFPAAPYEPEAITSARQSERATMGRDQQFTLDRWRKERYGYYRLVEETDRLIGRILEALQDSGKADNTVVIFSSDHGEMHGAHQLDRKWVLYEESASVPLIIQDPHGGRRGETDEALVSNGIDLLPTVCEYAGIDIPSDLPGESLVSRVRSGSDEWRDQVVVETVLPGNGAVGRMIRTERYAYHLYSVGCHHEQLFDMEEDPGQMVNLAVESRYENVLNEHRERLAEWCRATRDRDLSYYVRGSEVPIPGLGWVPVE